MKKLIFLFLLLLTTTAASAQISWNVKAGMNLSNISNIEDAKVRVGFRVGAGLEYSFSDLISLQPSLFFSMKGCGFPEIRSAKGSIALSYIELPVDVAFRIRVARSTNVVIAAGPYFAYAVSGKAKGSTSFGSGNINLFYGDSNWNRFDFGLGVGVGVELSSFFLGINCQYGLTNVHKANKSHNNINVGLGVGYRF